MRQIVGDDELHDRIKREVEESVGLRAVAGRQLFRLPKPPPSSSNVCDPLASLSCLAMGAAPLKPNTSSPSWLAVIALIVRPWPRLL